MSRKKGASFAGKGDIQQQPDGKQVNGYVIGIDADRRLVWQVVGQPTLIELVGLHNLAADEIESIKATLRAAKGSEAPQE